MKYRKSLLISSFEAFCLILLEVKKQIENEAFFNVNDTDDDKNAKIAAFQNRLYLFVKEKDSTIAYDSGKLASDTFQEVIYIMISLADEIFLSFEWVGKTYWRAHLLEQKFFGTNQAGEKLLANLDKFLQERHVQDSEIGLIYLYALSLGFQGKLRYEAELDFYLRALKEQVFFTIYKQAPKLYKKQEILFDQAIENVFVEKAQSRDNRMRFMMRVLLVCCGAYLFASHILWHVETNATWKIIKNKSSKPVFVGIADAINSQNTHSKNAHEHKVVEVK